MTATSVEHLVFGEKRWILSVGIACQIICSFSGRLFSGGWGEVHMDGWMGNKNYVPSWVGNRFPFNWSLWVVLQPVMFW